jgi:hypothetical protein
MPETSKRERIFSALKEAFKNGENKPAGLAVHRNRLRPMESDQLPALVLYPRPSDFGPSERVEHRELGPDAKVRRTLQVRIEGRALSTDPKEGPELAVDPIYRYAVKTVQAAGKLDGLLIKIPKELESGYGAAESEDGVLSGVAIDFELEYQTTRGNPDA